MSGWVTVAVNLHYREALAVMGMVRIVNPYLFLADYGFLSYAMKEIIRMGLEHSG